MQLRWLAPLGALLALGPLLPGNDPPLALGSLRPLGPGCQVDCSKPAVPYQPQPGDLLLCDELNPLEHALYRLAGTGPPCHSIIVFSQADGTPRLLDLNGPTARRAWVILFDIQERMTSFKGVILVRRLRRPLTADQQCALRQFAYAQDGKHFATGRVVLQVTPLSVHRGWRREHFAHTSFDRRRWFCSELVVAAACAAGILDPDAYPANAIYPRDLAFDEGLDISGCYEPPALWSPCPP